MEFVFWQNILSPHQSAFLRALADQGHSVTVVADKAMGEDRASIGWRVPNLGQARVVVDPLEEEVVQLIENSSNESVHIMAGARWTPLGNLATRQCIEMRRHVGIMSEAPDPRGLAGWGRWVKYATERYTRGYHYNFILAMGDMGVCWFRRCGYGARRLFPFTYVTESVPPAQANGANSETVLLFAGRFVKLKGLDLLLRAFAALSSRSEKLRLLGEGPDKTKLQNLAQELGIQNRVIWLPKCGSAGAQKRMARADVTILPSRKDGWGAVVNESLMAGTPVVCSTACGAADLIRHRWLGSVCRAGSVNDLSRALQHWINLGSRTAEERQRIQKWSECITGEVVARYFVGIMNQVYAGGPRPTAPWRLPTVATTPQAKGMSDLRAPTSAKK